MTIKASMLNTDVSNLIIIYPTNICLFQKKKKKGITKRNPPSINQQTTHQQCHMTTNKFNFSSFYCSSPFFSPQMQHMKRKRRGKGGGGVLSFFWPEPLIFLRAQQELGRRSPRLPRLLLVCAYHLHIFQGLTPNKALSRKFPPRILLVPCCHESHTCGGGSGRWWWRAVVQRQQERGGRILGGGKAKSGQQLLCRENKRESKAESEKKLLQERERERGRINEPSVCGGALSPLALSYSPTLCMSLSFWLLNQAPFCVKQLPLMTDLCWGQGLKLRTGSAVTQHARELCKLSPPLLCLNLSSIAVFSSVRKLLQKHWPWWTIASLEYDDKPIVNKSHKKTKSKRYITRHEGRKREKIVLTSCFRNDREV